jgi:hypothetical protein
MTAALFTTPPTHVPPDRRDALFLCNRTDVAVRPWLAAGWRCWAVDSQHPRGVSREGNLTRVGADVHELYRGHWWLPESVAFGIAFPDCTYLTISGNRWQRARGPGCVGRGLLMVDACWRLLLSYGCPWAIENPAVGRLSSAWCKPDFTFHPWEYAGYLADPETDNTTKNTGIWTGGGFVMPEKRPAPAPHRHDCHEAPPADDRADVRSVTPAGFAMAVFLANAGAEPAALEATG